MNTFFESIQAFVQLVIKTVLQIMGDKYSMLMMVEMLEHFAKLTENTIDDEIVAIIKQRLTSKQELKQE
jgi:hypothetical protein